MCNDYEQHVTHADYVRAVAAAELDAARSSASDLPTADDIKIGDLGPVLVAVGNGVGLRPMRFGWAPPRKGASPVFNFKSDGRHFETSGVGRRKAVQHEIRLALSRRARHADRAVRGAATHHPDAGHVAE